MRHPDPRSTLTTDPRPAAPVPLRRRASLILAALALTCGGPGLGCTGRSVGGPGADGGLPDAQAPDAAVLPDAGPGPDAGPPAHAWLAFLRGADTGLNPSTALYSIRDDGANLQPLSGDTDPSGAVEVFAMSSTGGVYREARLGSAGNRELRYRFLRPDGSSLAVTPFEDWGLRVPDLGLLSGGETAWALGSTGLKTVALDAGIEDTDDVGGVLLAPPDGQVLLTTRQTATDITVGVLDLESGQARDLHTFGSQQMPRLAVLDADAQVAYVGVRLTDVWALPLSGAGAHSVTDQWAVSGELLGRAAATGELLLHDGADVLALSPDTGAVRFRQALLAYPESLGVSPSGAFVVATGFEEAGAAVAQILAVGPGTVQTVSLAGARDTPWSCCCGGPRTGDPVFHEGTGRVALPIGYDAGMCACACMDEPPAPQDTPLQVLVLDLAPALLAWSVPHNGLCTPRFSPDGARLALCDNDPHLIPWAADPPASAIVVQDTATRETRRLTDPADDDSAVVWIP